MKKLVLITGATSGIGRATALRFAQDSDNLIITGRRSELLEELKEQLIHSYNIRVLALPFDVRNKEEVEKAISTLPAECRAIDVLVNNAGLAAGLKPIHEGLLGDWDQMIDTNIKGLLYMTRAVSPMMVERGKGHIINVGSIAGKEIYPNGNVYCGTKHAVDAITKGTRIDLVKYGIKVTQVAPGAAETEFSLVRFKGDAETAANVYKGYKPLSGMDVAEVIFYVTTLPAHVNINDVVVVPTAQASATIVHKV
jgi:3-hydroxy acid dehydrogenase / malonic semialdehyde reductase